MRNYFYLLLLAFACLFVPLACTHKEDNEIPEQDVFDVSGVVTENGLEVASGDDVTFRFHYGKGPSQTDKVILKADNGVDYTCNIKTVGSDYFTFTLADGIESGQYQVYILRGAARRFVGNTSINITSARKVEPTSGSTVYGTVECDGQGVPGVVVSDGYEVTTTDNDGIYQLKSQKRNGYVFISVPSGYEVSAEGILPKFHSILTAPAITPERRDFTLTKSANDKFTLYVLGDMHLANRTRDISQFAEFAKDMNASLNSTSGKKYALTLGDMTWDLYWYSNSFEFPQYLNEMNKDFHDIQVFHTMGNHDNDMNEIGDFNKSVRYTKYLAPYYYSFNIGKIHFIVMDDIDYKDVGTGSELRGNYKRDFTSEQMEWLAKDLSYVPRSTPLVIASHAPAYMPNGATTWKENLNGKSLAGQADTEDFLNAVKGYDVHFISGHTHRVFNYYEKEDQGYVEHNLGAVCASWWWSGHLTEGVHVAQDGSPGGYSIFKFDGADMEWKYKATGHPDSYQFRAYDMNEVKKVLTMSLAGDHPKFAPYVEEISKYEPNDILVNVWNWDPEWTVTVTENGKELPLVPLWANDPLHLAALSAKRLAQADASSTPSFLTASWNHFFKATASSATSTVEVKVKDRFGHEWTEKMERPKVFSTSDYKSR